MEMNSTTDLVCTAILTMTARDTRFNILVALQSLSVEEIFNAVFTCLFFKFDFRWRLFPIARLRGLCSKRSMSD